MAEGIPKATLRRAAREGKLEQVVEYALRRTDVAKILGADVTSVRRWTKEGRRGYVLPCWKVGQGRTAAVMFRLYDVHRFADRVGLPFRVEYAPPKARLAWENTRGPLD